MIPRSVQAWADEGASIQESLAQADEIKTFGDLPLIVLSAGLNQQMIADNSDHNIQIDRPEAAVAAIVKMVGQLW